MISTLIVLKFIQIKFFLSPYYEREIHFRQLVLTVPTPAVLVGGKDILHSL